MARPETRPHALSVTEASSMGVAAIVRDAEMGTDIVVERHHQPVAAVISVRRLAVLQEAQRDLRDIGLILSRAATDSGKRTELSEVIASFGFDRAALESELDEDLAAGRE